MSAASTNTSHQAKEHQSQPEVDNQTNTISMRLMRRGRRHLQEKLIECLLLLAACTAVFTTIGITYILLKESFIFFQHVSIWDFLTDTQWTPLFENPHYGILPLLSGTLVSSVVALCVAIPLGTIIAIYFYFVPSCNCSIRSEFILLLKSARLTD